MLISLSSFLTLKALTRIRLIDFKQAREDLNKLDPGIKRLL